MQIIIVDLGSQYTMIIGRRLRELGVRSEIVSPQDVPERLKQKGLKGIILSGGAASVYGEDMPKLTPKVLSCGVPVLGICLGMQWMVAQCGGKVEKRPDKAGYGETKIFFKGCADLVFTALPKMWKVWMSHGDSVIELPKGFRTTAVVDEPTVNGQYCAAIVDLERKLCGLQFHPEVNETEYGRRILENFLWLVCNAEEDWSGKSVLEEVRERLRKEIPADAKCVLGFSGGVDSSILAAILPPEVKKRTLFVTIDAGNLRMGELEDIRRIASLIGIPLRVLRKSGRFISAVRKAGINADAKRRAFQREYRRVLEGAARKFGATVLLQGTNSADKIESGAAGNSARIKRHHNVGLKSWLREFHPLDRLFKDEVRDLGRELGLPGFIVEREPFPGPGLFKRIVGVPVSSKSFEVVRWADAQVRHIVMCSPWRREAISQLVIALLGVRTKGVKGDNPVYGWMIGVRPVVTSDFMTARGFRLPDEVEERIESVLTRNHDITSVAFNYTSKPPATIEFE